ncbi:MAG: histidinol-phosphatase [Verrucomicrobium sp.]|nr:histidinol-phosphatase [Verrucomicrobium sp.]
MPRSTPVYFDSHMHTTLCKHAWGEPEEYARRAIEQGLKGIIITCHSPMPQDFWPHVRMADAQFDEYVALVEKCRQQFEGQLEVRLGLESDYFPGYERWAEKLHQRADFHYILGSVHWQGPEYRERFEDGSVEDFRRNYFDNLAASAETGLFDSLAHPDLIKNYHSSEWRYAEWVEDIAAALDRIARTGVAMELNTSGLYKSYPEMNPSPPMLKLMCERGIPVVIGSDSHKPSRVAENFITGLGLLQEVGYTQVSLFKNRVREDLLIDDILPGLLSQAAQPSTLAFT